MRFIPVLVSAGLLLLPTVGFAVGSEMQPASESCPGNRALQDERKAAGFVVRTFLGESDDGCFEVLKNDKVMYSVPNGGKFVIGNDVNKDAGNEVKHPPVIPLGTDMTGLGKPNIILIEWSGGAHCCFTFHILELGDKVREVARINAEDSDNAHFEDLNHNGIYEFVGWDWSFQYWHTDFADSPAPNIVLRFNGTGYELALDFMRKPAPSAEELNDAQRRVRDGKWTDGYPPPLLWGTMLNLIYTGHPDLAWRFVKRAWVSGHVSKPEFMTDFCGQLTASPYFRMLRPTLADAPCGFSQKD